MSIMLQHHHSQWCIAKTGGGYTQTGLAKGLKVPCLFMITEVSIRSQKNSGGWYRLRRIPAYTPNAPLIIAAQSYQSYQISVSVMNVGLLIGPLSVKSKDPGSAQPILLEKNSDFLRLGSARAFSGSVFCGSGFDLQVYSHCLWLQ